MGYAVRGRCGHRITITRRAGENDNGNRDRVLSIRAYGLRRQDGDYVLAENDEGEISFSITAAGQVYKQTTLCLGGTISVDLRELSFEITRRLQRA